MADYQARGWIAWHHHMSPITCPFAEGASIRQRIKTVREQTFPDEDGQPHRFSGKVSPGQLFEDS